MKRIFIQLLVLTSFIYSHTLLADSIQSLMLQAEEHKPIAQYQLATHYEQGKEVPVDLSNAFYWYKQAAENNYTPAKFKVADFYLNGRGTKKSIPQALFWLTDLAVKGNEKAQLSLGRVYESITQSPSPIDMAQLWYLIASEQNQAAEKAYAKVLENKYNARRAKQMTYIAQLNAIIPEDPELNVQLKPTPKSTFALSLVGHSIIFIIVVSLSSLFLLRRKKLARPTTQAKPTIQPDHQKIMTDQARVIKQQKKQLETLFRELKKRSTNSPSSPPTQEGKPNKLQMACAVLGFKTGQIPDEKKIKTRFKQLSKVYHPDMNGSEDEMKRLNAAFKIVVTYKKSNP
ncbi:J domain-containing protein [Vibrio profundum]|uniref:J domain-containing protein n=1 Tax=Vibrio profundum TaxID=2910247 RepID=UPI003D0CC128